MSKDVGELVIRKSMMYVVLLILLKSLGHIQVLLCSYKKKHSRLYNFYKIVTTLISS